MESRVALSAMLDGEEPGVDPEVLRVHLVGCPGCRAWQASAQDATRVARLAPADVPDLTEQVLAAVAADPGVAAARAERPSEHAQVLRWALALSAIAQLLLALPALFSDAGPATVHTGREMASFDVAVAIGFLLAAWRPARAAALVPIGVALAGCLLLTSTIDISQGAATLGHELNHLLAGVQAALLWGLSRASRLRERGQAVLTRTTPA